jgi:hypothetical protein
MWVPNGFCESNCLVYFLIQINYIYVTLIHFYKFWADHPPTKWIT